MKKIRKTILIAGISSILLYSPAFADEVEVVEDNQDAEQTVMAQILEEPSIEKGTVIVDILRQAVAWDNLGITVRNRRMV